MLIVLTGSYLLSAFAAGRWLGAVRVILFAAAALLALRNSMLPPRTARLILTAILAVSAVSDRGWLTETDQGRSIVSGPVIRGGAFRAFAAACSRRSWLATWPVTSV